MSSTNPLVQITNNLGYSLDIYDVFNPGTNGSIVPNIFTKLGTVSAGTSKTIQTIRSASQLQAMYSGNISALSNMWFYQFPVKVMEAVQFSIHNPPPLTFNITSTDQGSMIQSFLFHRYVMANPNSVLTKNLYAALNRGHTSSVNQFFASTQNFKSCTLSSWNAIMTWLQMFTSGWQGSFYLYEQAPNPTPHGYIPVLVATMNIVSTATENSATLKLCSTDTNGNPVYATPPQTTTLIMNGDGTMGDRNPGSDVSVNLTPVWMNVIQTTMQNWLPVSTYLAGAALTGTVINITVVSSLTSRQIPGKPSDKKKKGSFDANFKNISFESQTSSVSDFYSQISESIQEDLMNETMDDIMSDIQGKITEQLENGITPTEEYVNAFAELTNSFSDAKSKIESGDYSEACKELSSASENMVKAISENGSNMAEWETRSLQESADAVSKASESSVALDTAWKVYKEDMSNENEDSGFNVEEDSDFLSGDKIQAEL